MTAFFNIDIYRQNVLLVSLYARLWRQCNTQWRHISNGYAYLPQLSQPLSTSRKMVAFSAAAESQYRRKSFAHFHRLRRHRRRKCFSRCQSTDGRLLNESWSERKRATEEFFMWCVMWRYAQFTIAIACSHYAIILICSTRISVDNIVVHITVVGPCHRLMYLSWSSASNIQQDYDCRLPCYNRTVHLDG